MTDTERDMSAAELALGVLSGEERAAAMRRVLAEPEFAREVERWRDHFALLFAQWPEESPPSHLGTALDRAIAPVKAQRPFWPVLAFAASAVAAVLAGLLILQPWQTTAPPTVSTPPAMVANLIPAEGGTTVPAVYDATKHEILVAQAGFAKPGRSAELWLIPADGVPRSLGVLVGNARTSVRLSAEQWSLVDAKAALAVSDEPAGGSPSGKPTGAILASGSLISI